MAKTVRSAISIPIELKAKMDAIEESVNWSALACKAFEAKVAEVAKRKAVMDRSDVVARLRASKRKVSDGLFEAGFQNGEKWAKAEADVDELQRLEAFQCEVSDLGKFFSGTPGPGEQELACVVSDWVLGDEGFHDGVVSDPKEAGRIVDEGLTLKDEDLVYDNAVRIFKSESKMKNSDYLYGFIEGALNVWRQVKDEI